MGEPGFNPQHCKQQKQAGKQKGNTYASFVFKDGSNNTNNLQRQHMIVQNKTRKEQQKQG